MQEKNEQAILQKHLARFLIGEVFNTISEEDILKIKAPNVWTHKGKDLTEGQVNALRLEATSFNNSGLWRILKAELIYLAHQSGYVKSKTTEDQIAAKLLEYLVDVVQTKLDKMTKI